MKKKRNDHWTVGDRIKSMTLGFTGSRDFNIWTVYVAIWFFTLPQTSRDGGWVGGGAKSYIKSTQEVWCLPPPPRDARLKPTSGILNAKCVRKIKTLFDVPPTGVFVFSFAFRPSPSFLASTFFRLLRYVSLRTLVTSDVRPLFIFYLPMQVRRDENYFGYRFFSGS
jgi:hypothetical protein